MTALARIEVTESGRRALSQKAHASSYPWMIDQPGQDPFSFVPMFRLDRRVRPLRI